MSVETAPRGRRRASAVFRRGMIAVILVLGIAVGALTAGNALRGPRLAGAQINAAAAITRAGMPLVLNADQPVRALTRAQVRVTPRAAFQLQVQGAQIVLRFTGLLHYGTDYRVSIPSVTGSDTGSSGAIDYRFATPDPQVYSLLRQSSTGGQDEVIRRSLGIGAQTVVYASARIQEYAVLPEQLAVVTLQGSSDDGTLKLVPLDGGPTSNVVVPAQGAIEQVRSSGASGLLGYTVTSDLGVTPALNHVLYVLDPSTGSGVSTVIDGLEGSPLSVLDWAWVPGTSEIVAQGFDESLYLINPLGGGRPQALGAHAELRGFLAGTSTLVVADPTGGSTIDLTRGRTAALRFPSDRQTPETYVGQIVLVGPGTDYLEVVATPSPSVGATDYRILRVTGSGVSTLYRPAATGSRVGDVCLSPNGEYLAVEVIGPGSQSDDYPNVVSYSGASTVFVDVVSGAVRGGIPGFDVDWCSSRAS